MIMLLLPVKLIYQMIFNGRKPKDEQGSNQTTDGLPMYNYHRFRRGLLRFLKFLASSYICISSFLSVCERTLNNGS